MYRTKNLCFGSVVTLFLLCNFSFLIEFFFLKTNIIHLSLFQLKSKQNRFPVKEITLCFNVIGYDCPNFSNYCPTGHVIPHQHKRSPLRMLGKPIASQPVCFIILFENGGVNRAVFHTEKTLSLFKMFSIPNHDCGSAEV